MIFFGRVRRQIRIEPTPSHDFAPNAPTMNILLGVEAIHPPITGIGRYNLELARRLPHISGIDAVRFWKRDGLVDHFEPGESRELGPPRLRSRLLRNRFTLPLHRAYRTWHSSRTLARLADHVYHGPNYHVPEFAGPSIATIHDLSVFRFPDFHPRERVEATTRTILRAVAYATLLITDSLWVRRELIERFALPEDRVVSIPLGVGPEFHPRDEAETAQVLRAIGLRHGGYTLCVATIEPRKNIELLIRAYESLPGGLRNRFPLLLIGDRGWRSDALHRRIESGVHEGWIRYPGYVPEAALPVIYAGARAFALVSHYEGFGLPLLEAFASGIPAVTSVDSALSELADGAALLAHSQDVESIRTALRASLEDDAWRPTARARGLKIAERHTWSGTAARTVAAYAQVATAAGLASGRADFRRLGAT